MSAQCEPFPASSQETGPETPALVRRPGGRDRPWSSGPQNCIILAHQQADTGVKLRQRRRWGRVMRRQGGGKQGAWATRGSRERASWLFCLFFKQKKPHSLRKKVFFPLCLSMTERFEGSLQSVERKNRKKKRRKKRYGNK